MRIVSANLRNGGASPGAFAELVTELAADVVTVQEAAPQQAEALLGVLPYGRIDPAVDFGGMGIALRRPGEVEPLPLSFRQAFVARLRPEEWSDLGAPLEVIGVHVWAPHHYPFWRTAVRRRRQLESLVAHLDASGYSARILMGDLNSTPSWPVYRRLCTRLTDAALEVAQKNRVRPKPTWGPFPGGPRLLRIDHALVGGVTVEDFGVARVPGTDHHAIVFDASVPGVAGATGHSC